MSTKFIGWLLALISLLLALAILANNTAAQQQEQATDSPAKSRLVVFEIFTRCT